jgi:hypothetical protein
MAGKDRMIGRKDFMFTIGYDGSTAVVDGSLKRRFGSLGTTQLSEKGLLKQALCSAVFEGREEALSLVLERYNARAEHELSSVEELKRMFGVFEVPQGIARVLVIG